LDYQRCNNLIQQEHKIDENVFYIHKIDHRNHSSVKSQWIITEGEERACFKLAYTAKWNVLGYNYNYWGLHFSETGQIGYLGISKPNGSERYDIFIAKFVDGNKNSKWHGYPANHVLLIISSDARGYTFLEGEPVNWRVFPKSKYYTNQLHAVYDDYFCIYSFNDDYFVDQKQKQAGIQLRKLYIPS
jgi:hypothetical protein